LAFFSWATLSHFKIAQNTAAVKNDESAYTSPSTAENQNESVKVKAMAPTNPLPQMLICSALDNSSEGKSLRAKCTILQYSSIIDPALASADKELTINAAFDVSGAKIENTRPKIIRTMHLLY